MEFLNDKWKPNFFNWVIPISCNDIFIHLRQKNSRVPVSQPILGLGPDPNILKDFSQYF